MTFPTPEKAASSLLMAIQSGNFPLFLSIAGNHMAEFWRTGDPEKDEIERYHFADAARRYGFKTDLYSRDKRILSVGNHEQLFPAPLVKTDSGWRFDDEAGFVELTTRRIHRNEIAAVESCRRFRDAEFTYFKLEAAFTQKIRSTPGQSDGLVWSDEEDESPMGPAFAAAAFMEQHPHEQPKPLFGYYFKIFADRLPHRENSPRSEGVALIAWPAEYSVDGFRTFVIDHLGDVYQKDLGSDTTRAVEGMTVFIPNQSWRKVDGE
jgi:hypothetical protein